MSLPNYEYFMKPMLEVAKDGRELTFNDSIDLIVKKLKLTEEEITEMLPSGSGTVLRNRIGWAKTYLVKSGLLKMLRRGIFSISNEGKIFLEKNVEINSKTLPMTEDYQKFLGLKKAELKEIESSSGISPSEMLENSFQFITKELENNILEKVKQASSDFFEELVVDLLLAMGYGGSRIEAGKVLQRTNDEGIDGLIKEDRLGLDIIYIQAKRWQNVVQRPEIQKFAGALLGKKAKKGVFITTSDFSKGALEYVQNLESKIILINGAKLSELMREFNVGVEVKGVYEIKEINSDYFEG